MRKPWSLPTAGTRRGGERFVMMKLWVDSREGFLESVNCEFTFSAPHNPIPIFLGRAETLSGNKPKDAMGRLVPTVHSPNPDLRFRGLWGHGAGSPDLASGLCFLGTHGATAWKGQ